jgi:hybrid cluster-associated redox disulfide protein
MNPPKTSPITKNTNIGDLIIQHPHIAQVLSEDYGLHCVTCFAASFDTLENGAQIHGMNSQEISDMIARLNKIHKAHLQENNQQE